MGEKALLLSSLDTNFQPFVISYGKIVKTGPKYI